MHSTVLSPKVLLLCEDGPFSNPISLLFCFSYTDVQKPLSNRNVSRARHKVSNITTKNNCTQNLAFLTRNPLSHTPSTRCLQKGQGQG